MIECPNCGSGLRFDISSQQNICDSCGSHFEPFSFDPDFRDATESDSFSSTVFMCPQCGGEIYSTDDTIAGFCSFCGASTILTGRMEQTRRPDYLIPFQITKEACKESYAQMMRRAIFAPKELRDRKYIDGFRGIYMPYWSYDVTQKGKIEVPGRKEYTSHGYDYTEYYRLTGNIDAGYEGLSYDASSSFDDNFSEALAPYDMTQKKDFTPAYLCGFYADTADVDESAYEDHAKWFALESSVRELRDTGIFHRENVEADEEKINPNTLNTEIEQVHYSLIPVWFLSYRKKDRVAYATVNGQTGRAVSDLPISPVRFLIGSLILAVPIFLLLNLIATTVPSRAMMYTGLFSLLTLMVYWGELKAIERRNLHADDYGYLFLHSKKDAEKLFDKRDYRIRINKRFSFSDSLEWGMLLLYGLFMLAGVYFVVEEWIGNMNGRIVPTIGWAVMLIAAIVTGSLCKDEFDHIAGKKRKLGISITYFAILIGAGIRFAKPVYDIYYYLGSLLLLVGIFVTIADIILVYNVLVTRPLPQFEHKGGDDDAD